MDNWVRGQDYPRWYTERSLKTVSRGYVLSNETPREAYRRVANAAAGRLQMPELAEDFFEVMWNGWLGPASPVFSNMGTERGLPISCFSLSIPDSVDGIYKSIHELAMMTKHGGGVGMYAGRIRGRGKDIKSNGKSEGVVPWLKVADSAILATSQGGVRKGAAAAYLDIEHLDIDEFIRIRRPEGDINRHCMNLHHAVCIGDEFMEKVETGSNADARKLFEEVMKNRFETGEPFIMYKDTVNKFVPEWVKKHNLTIETSNICTEILLPTDELHSFVCCLSSLNLYVYNDWRDWRSSTGMSLPQLSIYFLDGVLQEFIDRARGIPGFERAVRFALKSRAVGLGVMGWHSLLQSEMTPINSFRATLLNKAIFKFIREESDKATRELATLLGEPEWLKGFGIRNGYLLALAPTETNAGIVSVSPSTEPWAANRITKKSAKGTFDIKNPELEKLLTEKGKNNNEIWSSIRDMNGSVQHLDFLTDEEKEVFLTAREIDQVALVDLAADRHPYVDQGQSLNLFFDVNADPRYVYQVHLRAWKKKIRTLYYMRTGSVLKANFKLPSDRTDDDCVACEG